MGTHNRATIIGRLGGAPEVRTTNGGTRVANLSLATNQRWTDRNGNEQEKTNWHRVVAWGKKADVVEQYLGKGDLVHVEGPIEYRQYEGDDGETKYVTEIKALRLTLLGSGDGSRGGGGSGQSRDDKRVEGAASGGGSDLSDFDEDELLGDDDLPF